MATVEKPLKVRIKTNTKKNESVAAAISKHEEAPVLPGEAPTCTNADDHTSDKVQLANFEQFDTHTTSSAASIVSTECLIASFHSADDDDVRSNIAEACEASVAIGADCKSLHEEIAQADGTATPPANSAGSDEIIVAAEQTPSAPPTERTVSHALPAMLPIVAHYPQLQALHNHVETKSEVVFQLKSPVFRLAHTDLLPFTEEQLKQIYHCVELDLVKQFELEYLMNSLLETSETDPLYLALLEYYNLQSKLTMNLHDITKYREDAIALQKDIWTEVPITKTFSATCGDGVVLKETVTYNIAKVDGKGLEAASAGLKRLYELLCHTYTTNMITAKITKVKIDEIINDLLSHPVAHKLPSHAAVTLHRVLDAEALQCVAQLRRAISILFGFVRRLSPNKTFDGDLKAWLRLLVGLHLRIATKEDHWFLLFNLLRCPSGVGTWANAFLQFPIACRDLEPQASSSSASPSSAEGHILPLAINSPETSHCITVLQILLLPIKKRNEYLKAYTQSQKECSDPVKEERWILIDSDGEDSHTSNGECAGLKENDLIALLNQIPFEVLFTSVLNIEKFLDDYVIPAESLTAVQMLRVVAFSSRLIEVLGEGMLTYNTERYKQFAKRLGRLVRHTLQYVSDYYELFLQNHMIKDLGTCERIAVEFNALLIKSCRYIYRTRNLATWQYFSSLPFSNMDTETIWQIFYYLNLGFPSALPAPVLDYAELLHSADVWVDFNVAHADSSSEDLYYLLQAFFEMANERDKVKDWELIKIICQHTFNIGFINDNTRDTCYKAARDMLINLTLAYEDLMSCLLLQLKVRFADIENAAYLFKALPLANWKPDMESFEILSNWLLHFDFKSKENMLARIVFSHLNWSFDCDGRLFLPHNIHVRMASLVSEALTKHAPEVIGLSGLSESMRQLSSLIDFSQATKEQFATWCWSMVSILRLHLMDQSVASVKRTLQNPTEPLMFVPELERIELIYQGVTEHRPLAVYVALLESLHGHSIPLICQKGFDLMKLLLTDYRHAAVIRCLELIAPLFLETPETLANCESFQGVLNGLLNADRTYIKLAKDMLYANTVGPVLELFDNMIHHQIVNYTIYGLSTPLNLINVWLNCLTALPNWPNTSVVYLLDKILRVAYQFPDARVQAVQFFHNYYKDCDEWKGAKSGFKTFFGSSPTRLPALSPYQPWLAVVLLEIEFQTQDIRFWSELLRQLTTANAKNNVEAVLKKTLSVVKVPSFPAHMLVIYKYANLLASMDVKHPLFPIVNQKFFELYLSRVQHHYAEHSFQNRYGVSDKFQEFNMPVMKKIKANIKAAELHYENEATKFAAEEARSYVSRDCAKMMKTYALWLEETSINSHDIGEHNYPPLFNKLKLTEILNGNSSHWTEFIYLPGIRQLQREQANQWARTCYRYTSTPQMITPLPTKVKRTPVERIKVHLRSYDLRSSAPALFRPKEHRGVQITATTLNELNALLKTLNSTATKYHFQTSELKSLNHNYLDFVVQLYEMVPYQELAIKSCTSQVFNRRCSNPARITTTLEHIRMDKKTERRVQSYRERHDQIVEQMLEMNADEFAQSIQKVSAITQILLAGAIMSRDADGSATAMQSLVTKTGIQFFYTLIAGMTDVTMKFTPTNQFYSTVLSEVAVFIQENQESEGMNVLQRALERPDLLKVLTGAFVPYRTRPEFFLKMYKFLIDSHLKRYDTKILFVLLSKFDLLIWLNQFEPKLHDINQLLQMVLDGLESWSQPDSSLLQDQFRRHLVHIFNYDFPQHYGEVMQLVLDRISDQKLMPVVLLDLLNWLLEHFNCIAIDVQTTSDQIEEIAVDFARRQNLFNLKAATDTVMLFARHFQKERLHHGLHGLYPKHKDYCQPLSAWFACFGHVVVVTAICTYQELLADQITDVVFGSIIEMYSPWLIGYTEKTVQQSSANWIRQLTENGKKMLNPWSEQHAGTSKMMITPFIKTLNFVLDSLPVTDKALAHTFSWYVHHFTIPNMDQYVQAPIQEGLSALPWERFRPQPNYIDMLYDSLQKYIPGAHAMLGHIFIRINWNAWITECLPTYPSNEQRPIVSRLFTVFVKISFEPNIHIHINTSKILEDAIHYPWYLVNIAELTELLTWFVTTVEPSLVLQIPSESNYADRAVLDLIRLTCAMKCEQQAFLHAAMDVTAKRILYTRSMVRLLRASAAKNQKLLATKDGVRVFNTAFVDLLLTMDAAVQTLTSAEDQKRLAFNLMVEVIVPMQTQSEESSNLHIDQLIEWQLRSPTAGNPLMLSIPNALGRMKAFIAGCYRLLEACVEYYFRSSEETKSWHTPTWANLLQTLLPALDKLQMMPLVHGSHFLTLHIFVLYKLEQLGNHGDKITFLQDLSQLVQNLKTVPQTEPHLAIVWGLIISRGAQILIASEHVKKPLLMLARHLQICSTQAEGWGDGLLGAIGLKRDVVTSRRKILTRCLACVIFSLFPSLGYEGRPQPSEEFASALRELTALLGNKKFNDLKGEIVQAVSIIEGSTKAATPRDMPHLVCRLIGCLYAPTFLTTLPEIWDFDYQLVYGV